MAVQQIANLRRDYGVPGKSMGEAVRRAFSVQPVTDAVFKGCKGACDDAVKRIAAAGIGRAAVEQFTHMLFSRLLFVHFVSRKGWPYLKTDSFLHQKAVELDQLLKARPRPAEQLPRRCGDVRSHELKVTVLNIKETPLCCIRISGLYHKLYFSGANWLTSSEAS